MLLGARTAAWGGGKNPRVPTEYQEVSHLRSTGLQRIDTGVIPVRTTATAIEFKLNSLSAGKGVFGNYSANGHYYIYQNGVSSLELGFGNKNVLNAQTTTEKRVVNFSYPNCIIDGRTIVTAYNFVNATISLPLFTIRAGNYFYDGSDVSVYSLKITDSGTGNEILDFVPCYRKSDGERGMYDLVSNTFFGNVGSGEFLIGEPI